MCIIDDTVGRNFESWLACELFDYLVDLRVISEDAEFEDWKHDRADMIELAKKTLN